jgi:thiol-disulfide isomerase/thioredoxin
LEELHALVALRPNDAAAQPAAREGRLELAGVRLHGSLVDARVEKGSGLLFKPHHSENASPLALGVSGRLVYREPPPPKPAPQATARPAPQAPAMLGGAVRIGVRTLIGTRQPAPPRHQPSRYCVLHLRCGDVITCQVRSINEEGLLLESASANTAFVPHDQIRAVELDANAPPVRIDKTKKERLLMLPRMQRDNPPTHLIRSLEGDYLRGRLLGMDDKQLQVEVQLVSQSLPREQVARIIWLHPDEIVGGQRSDHSAEPAAGTRVQAAPADDNRLTFVAEELNENILSGRSPVLGACQMNLTEVHQLLIGDAIEQAAATLAFHSWRLTPAPQPLPTPEAETPGSEGLDSVLVGKPAPNIELDFLEGKKFRLADYKNKVLLLDFWASWCGPCLQAMPQVDKVAREFADQDVELVAINLQEAPDRIRAALARLKLETTVALDHDGRVAERYGANSIPQTVIIDREGKVARLFVGGGARFDEQLRQALTAVLGSKAENSQ